jgi:3D (Asp-Asp-Asp) domain-containing protein
LIASVHIAVRTAAATGLLCLAFSGEVAAANPEKIGRAMVTFYWVIDEKSPEYRGDRSAVLRDPRGRVIATTTRKFKLDLVRQGSGWLRDGRTVIYIKKVGEESRFRISASKYGLASSGCRLVPYRTIAADPRFLKSGTKISIPQLKGARLPDGTIHDGMFVAADRGHFRGARVDLFVGVGSAAARPFIRKGYGSLSQVTVYKTGRTKHCHP